MRNNLAAAAFAAALFVGAAQAQQQVQQIVTQPPKPYDPPIFRITGRGEIFLPPDQARVGVSFYSPGRTAAEAMQAVSARARVLEAAVRAINSERVTLDRVDVVFRPVMREGGERRPDRITGYEASAAVTILVRDLALVPRAVEAAISAQPDSFDDVRFSLSDPAAARRQAREAAIADAMEKARIYVGGAGHRLGQLLHMEEGGAQGVDRDAREEEIVVAGYRASVRAQDAPAPPPPPIAAERQRYTAEISLIFEIARAPQSRTP
jgi:uncharacterized protein YggE